jgi:hypothetical protein
MSELFSGRHNDVQWNKQKYRTVCSNIIKHSCAILPIPRILFGRSKSDWPQSFSLHPWDIYEISGCHSTEHEDNSLVGYSNDGGSTHLWKINLLLEIYAALYPKRLSSLSDICFIIWFVWQTKWNDGSPLITVHKIIISDNLEWKY